MHRTLFVALASLAVAGAIALFGSSPAVANQASGAATYGVDGVHSTVLFRIRHAGVAPFYGRFNRVDGEFSLDRESPGASAFEFTIDLTSVDTANKDRDKHVMSPDFFSVKQFPEATFKATSVRSLGDDKYELRGPLSLHGVEKEIVATLVDYGVGSFRGNEVTGFEATFSIKRSDFGITTYLPDDLSDNGPLGNTIDLIVAVEGKRK